MSEFTPLREAVDTLAGRSASPDFGELKRRATRRGRRRIAVVAAAAAAVIAGTAAVVTGLDGDRRTAPVDEPMPTPKPVTAPNGWVAIDDYRDGGSIFLVRPGEDARRLEVPGSDGTSDACPAWSPDGTRLMFGRSGGTWESPSGDAELVIVPVGQNGTAGAPTVIGLDGFEALSGGLEGYGAHPCGTWAPDGRWVAFAGTDGVWVVDTQTGEIRRLPDLRPSDLEWRPGTDELTIAGDMGTDWETTPRCLPRSPSTRCQPVSSATSALSRPHTSHGPRTARPWRPPAANPNRIRPGATRACRRRRHQRAGARRRHRTGGTGHRSRVVSDRRPHRLSTVRRLAGRCLVAAAKSTTSS